MNWNYRQLSTLYIAEFRVSIAQGKRRMQGSKLAAQLGIAALEPAIRLKQGSNNPHRLKATISRTVGKAA